MIHICVVRRTRRTAGGRHAEVIANLSFASAAWAADSRAMGTLYGEQDT
jgi:hypothetical protein